MRIDPMRFFTERNDISPKRMGCIGKGENSVNGAGFGAAESSCSVKKPFRKLVEEVVSENRAARQITASAMKKRAAAADMNSSKRLRRAVDDTAGGSTGAEGVTAGRKSMLTDKADGNSPSMINGSCNTDKPLLNCAMILVDKNSARDAEAIISEAVAVVSEALGLSIFPQQKNLSLEAIDGDTLEQLAEMIFCMKKLVHEFEQAMTTGMTIVTPRARIDGSSIDALADALRANTFKIEVACGILGIAEPVQRQVAVKMELYGPDGIVQATDPSTLTMAAQHTKRLFGALFTDSDKNGQMVSLTDNAKIPAGENDGKQPIVPVDTVGSDDGSRLESMQFDTRVRRVLLKIDNMYQVDFRNAEAAIGKEKPDPIKDFAYGLPLAKNISAREDGNHPQSASMADIRPGMPQPTGASAESRITASLLKMADAPVMEQIAGRFQAVLRSGLSEVRLQLRPETLGEVRMRIRVEGDIVQAKIEVQNQQVKEIMERNLPALRDALAQQNLTSGSFDIQVNSGLGRNSGNMPQGLWRGDDAQQEDPDRDGREREDGFSQQQQTRSDTGRRFGGNSVEYFA